MNHLHLAPYVGKKVLIQLRAPDAWIVVHNDSGQPLPIMHPERDQAFVPVPFILGTVLKKEANGMVFHVVEILDENKMKLEIWINPEAVLSVTEAIGGEPGRIVQLVS